jgi:hypothetical protein
MDETRLSRRPTRPWPRILEPAAAGIVYGFCAPQSAQASGVTELLTPLTLMMNTTGIETGWRMIQGTPGFFRATKKPHNALLGECIELSDTEKAVYEEVVFENSTRLHLEDCNVVVVHDRGLRYW